MHDVVVDVALEVEVAFEVDVAFEWWRGPSLPARLEELPALPFAGEHGGSGQPVG